MMSEFNWESFGPTVDLCVMESIYLEEMERQESLLESFVAYVGNVKKEELNNKEYVKSLIRNVNAVEVTNENMNKLCDTITKVCVVIQALTIVGIPIALLTLAFNSLLMRISRKTTKQAPVKAFNNLIKVIDKSIASLEKQKSEEKDKSKKKEFEDTIKKLKASRVELEKELESRKNKENK